MSGLMSDPHKEIINSQLRRLFLEKLDSSEEFLAVMRENNCITEEIAEKVKINRTISGRSDANEAFIKGLMTRPEKAFKQFVKALIETEQGHLADAIDEELKQIGEEPLSPGIRNPPSASATSVDSVDNTVSEIEEIVAYIVNTGKNLPELSIQSMSADKKTSILESQSCYRPRDSSGQRMRVVIINNVFFRRGSEYRARMGSVKDVKNLTSLFRQFNCDIVPPATNKTAQEMKNILKKESGREDLKDFDVLIIVLMSHGKKNEIYGKDCEYVNILPDVTDYFSNENCPQMLGKPKLFFIQACQIGKEDLTLKHSELRNCDTYIAMSTVSGDVAWLTEGGSLLIRAIVCAIAWHSHYKDFGDIMAMVRQAVEKVKLENSTSQLPCEWNTLSKNCFLIH